MNRNIIPSFLIFIFFFTGISYGQDDVPENYHSQMRRYVDSVATKNKFNGNLLVAVDNKVIYKSSVGLANYYTGNKLNDSTSFLLCSVSKQFTATGIMILKERRLGYDDDIRKFIPELPYQGVTIRNMLTHTSGLPKYEDYLMKRLGNNSIAHNDDIIKMIETVRPPLLFKPGEQWEYCDTAYELLATVIERVSGVDYSVFLRRNIFEPLRMNHTFNCINRREQRQIIKNYALPFIYSDSLTKYIMPDSLNEFHIVIALDGTQGAGSINSTIDDMFKWDVGLKEGKIISEKTMNEAFTPVRLNNGKTFNYGFGWFLNESQTNRVIMHPGAWYGYKAFVISGLDKNNFVIALSNNESDSYLIAKNIFEKINQEKLKHWP